MVQGRTPAKSILWTPKIQYGVQRLLNHMWRRPILTNRGPRPILAKSRMASPHASMQVTICFGVKHGL